MKIDLEKKDIERIIQEWAYTKMESTPSIQWNFYENDRDNFYVTVEE